MNTNNYFPIFTFKLVSFFYMLILFQINSELEANAPIADDIITYCYEGSMFKNIKVSGETATYTITSTGSGTLSTTTVNQYDFFTLSDLNEGNSWDLTITDENECSTIISGIVDDCDKYWQPMCFPRNISKNLNASDRVPQIDGKYVVWDTFTDIFYFDLENGGDAIQITNDNITDRNSFVSNDRIVWTKLSDSSPFNSIMGDIYYYDLATMTGPFAITPSNGIEGTDDVEPRISDNIVVWRRNKGNFSQLYDIYYYDLASSTTPTNLSENLEENQENPRVSNGIIVWQSGTNFSEREIYYYDTNTSTGPINISNSPNIDDLHPEICGSKIVWEHGNTSSNTRIYYMDLETMTEPLELPLPNPSSSQCQSINVNLEPKISNDAIVWRGCGIFYFDLATMDISSDTPIEIATFEETDFVLAYGGLLLEDNVVLWESFVSPQQSRFYNLNSMSGPYNLPKLFNREMGEFVNYGEIALSNNKLVSSGTIGAEDVFNCANREIFFYDLTLFDFELNTPNNPTLNSNVSTTVCARDELELIVEGTSNSNQTYLWFDTPSTYITHEIFVGNHFKPCIESDTSFWVMIQDTQTLCESELVEMSITLNEPEAPTANPVEFCEGETIELTAIVELEANEELRFFSDYGHTLVGNTTISGMLVNTGIFAEKGINSFYVEVYNTMNQCKSNLTEIPIKVNAPKVLTGIPYCGNDGKLFMNVRVIGNTESHTISNTGNGTINSSMVSNNDFFVLNNLSSSDNYEFTVTDENGCSTTINGMIGNCPFSSNTIDNPDCSVKYLGSGRQPKISGSQVIWRQFSGVMNLVYMDLATMDSPVIIGPNYSSPYADYQIKEDIIVWSQSTNGHLNIYYFNTKEMIPGIDSAINISNDGNAHDLNPQIYKDKIVWRKEPDCTYEGTFLGGIVGSSWGEVYFFDASAFWDNNSETPVPINISNTPYRKNPFEIPDNCVNDQEAQIWGEHIVWTENTCLSNTAVYYYNLIKQKAPIRLSSEDNLNGTSQIENNIVIWAGDNLGVTDLFYYDLNTMNPPINLTNDRSAFVIDLSLSDGIAAWRYQNIGYYDFNTMTGPFSIPNSSPASKPQISGDIIVWSEQNNGDEKVFYYNIQTKQGPFEIPDISPDNDKQVEIDGNLIVWTGEDSGTGDIYLYDVSLAPPILPILSDESETEVCIGNKATLELENLHANEVAVWYDDANKTTELFVGNPFFPTISANSSFWVLKRNVQTDCESDLLEVVVEAIDNFTVTIGGNLEFCKGEQTILSTEINYENYNWSNGGSNQSIEVKVGDIYTVTVSSGESCTASTSVQVVEKESPTPIILGDSAHCPNQHTILEVGNYSQYEWSNNAITKTILAIAGVYSVTVTDDNGCTGFTSIEITEYTSPTPTIVGDFDYCEENEGSILDAGNYAEYTWSNDANTRTILAMEGTYTVTVTDASGCTGVASVKVTENSKPNPIISGNLTYCIGENTVLDAGDYVTYVWSNNSMNQTIVATAGVYTVTVTNNDNCIGTASIEVIENSNVVFNISGNKDYCSNDTFTILDAGAYEAYNWSNDASTQTITAVAGNYTVTVSNANGCMGSASVMIDEHPNPIPTITGDLVYCQYEGSTLLSVGIYESYIWSNQATTQSISVSEGVYTVTVSNANGCTGTTSIQITENINPIPTIIGNLTYCIGGSTLLEVGEYNHYIWSNQATTRTIEATVGGYTVTVSNSENCTGTMSVEISENNSISVEINGTMDFCANASGILDAGGYSSNDIYSWSSGQTSQSILISNQGVFTVTVTNDEGCSGTSSIKTSLHPVSLPSIVGTFATCLGGTTSLSVDIFDTYMWSTNETTQLIQTNSAGIYTITVTNVYGCSGTATVEVEGTCDAFVGEINHNGVTICPDETIIASIEDVQASDEYDLLFILFEVDNLGVTTYVDSNDSGEFSVSSGEYQICAYVEYEECIPVPSPFVENINSMGLVGRILDGCYDYICSDITVPEPFETLGGTGQAQENNSTGQDVYLVEICGGIAPYTIDFVSSGGFASIDDYPSAISGCIEYQIVYSEQTNWTLTITDANDCTEDEFVFTSDGIEDEPLPQIVINTVTPETCPGFLDGAINIDVSGGDNSCEDYSFTATGPNYTLSGTFDSPEENEISMLVLDSLASGSYSITVTDCSGTSTIQDVNVSRSNLGGRSGRGSGGCTGKIANITDDSLEVWNVFPNPVTQETIIEFILLVDSDVAIDVFSIDGKKAATIFEGRGISNQLYRIPLDINQLSSGIYLLQFKMDNSTIYYEKLYILNK